MRSGACHFSPTAETVPPKRKSGTCGMEGHSIRNYLSDTIITNQVALSEMIARPATVLIWTIFSSRLGLLGVDRGCCFALFLLFPPAIPNSPDQTRSYLIDPLTHFKPRRFFLNESKTKGLRSFVVARERNTRFLKAHLRNFILF